MKLALSLSPHLIISSPASRRLARCRFASAYFKTALQQHNLRPVISVLNRYYGFFKSTCLAPRDS